MKSKTLTSKMASAKEREGQELGKEILEILKGKGKGKGKSELAPSLSSISPRKRSAQHVDGEASHQVAKKKHKNETVSAPSLKSDPKSSITMKGRSRSFGGGTGSSDITAASSITQGTSSLAKKFSKLTPLQERMRAKLDGAKFRLLNEQLYTSRGDEVFDLF